MLETQIGTFSPKYVNHQSTLFENLVRAPTTQQKEWVHTMVLHLLAGLMQKLSSLFIVKLLHDSNR